MNHEFGIFLNLINLKYCVTLLMLMFCLIMVTSELIKIYEGEKNPLWVYDILILKQLLIASFSGLHNHHSSHHSKLRTFTEHFSWLTSIVGQLSHGPQLYVSSVFHMALWRWLTALPKCLFSWKMYIS